MSIHTYPKFTNMHNRKLKRCMNRQRLLYLYLKKKSLVCPDDLVKRTKFLENVRGSSNLTSQILGFLCTLTMLVLNVSVTYFEVRRNQIRNLTFFQTTESKKEVQNQAKFHVAFHRAKKQFSANFSQVLGTMNVIVILHIQTC